MELAKVMNLLQGMMNEPWAKSLIQSSGVASADLKDAQDGKPAPSAPEKTPLVPGGGSPGSPTQSEPEKPLEPPTLTTVAAASVERSDLSAPAAEPPQPEQPQVINTSTHRASYARLCRKMQGMEEVDAPNMSRLFNGSRKDWYP